MFSHWNVYRPLKRNSATDEVGFKTWGNCAQDWLKVVRISAKTCTHPKTSSQQQIHKCNFKAPASWASFHSLELSYVILFIDFLLDVLFFMFSIRLAGKAEQSTWRPKRHIFSSLAFSSRFMNSSKDFLGYHLCFVLCVYSRSRLILEFYSPDKRRARLKCLSVNF